MKPPGQTPISGSVNKGANQPLSSSVVHTLSNQPLSSVGGSKSSSDNTHQTPARQQIVVETTSCGSGWNKGNSEILQSMMQSGGITSTIGSANSERPGTILPEGALPPTESLKHVVNAHQQGIKYELAAIIEKVFVNISKEKSKLLKSGNKDYMVISSIIANEILSKFLILPIEAKDDAFVQLSVWKNKLIMDGLIPPDGGNLTQTTSEVDVMRSSSSLSVNETRSHDDVPANEMAPYITSHKIESHDILPTNGMESSAESYEGYVVKMECDSDTEYTEELERSEETLVPCGSTSMVLPTEASINDSLDTKEVSGNENNTPEWRTECGSDGTMKIIKAGNEAQKTTKVSKSKRKTKTKAGGKRGHVEPILDPPPSSVSKVLLDRTIDKAIGETCLNPSPAANIPVVGNVLDMQPGLQQDKTLRDMLPKPATVSSSGADFQ